MPIPEFHVYDVSEVSINLLGVLIEGGFGSDEVIKVTKADDRYKAFLGADGNVSRADTHNNMATIELQLAQTSPLNAALWAVYNAGTVGPVEIADLNGASLHVASKAWIAREPDADYSREVKVRVWKIECADMQSASLGQVT